MGESLLIILVVGIIAGRFVGQTVQGTGYGIIGDLAFGALGAVICSRMIPQLGIHFHAGLAAVIINATLRALILLLVIGFSRRGSGWHGNWRRGW